MVDIERLGLKAGDRLEPSMGLLDVGKFDYIAAYPFIVLFWRQTCSPVTYHRNPIICSQLFTGVHCFAVDTLHTLHLGVFKQWILRALWCLLVADVFGCGATQHKEIIRLGLLSFKAALFKWYAVEEKRYPSKKLSRIANLTPSMIGSEGGSYLRTKAGENSALLRFVLRCVREHGVRLREVDVDALVGSGEALVAYMDILGGHGRVIPGVVQEELMGLCMVHCDAALAAGVHMIPKHHLWIHMTRRICSKGNPRFYSTFLDESLNAVLSDIAASNHRRTFERKTFQKFALATKEGHWLINDCFPIVCVQQLNRYLVSLEHESLPVLEHESLLVLKHESLPVLEHESSCCSCPLILSTTHSCVHVLVFVQRSHIFLIGASRFKQLRGRNTLAKEMDYYW